MKKSTIKKIAMARTGLNVPITESSSGGGSTAISKKGDVEAFSIPLDPSAEGRLIRHHEALHAAFSTGRWSKRWHERIQSGSATEMAMQVCEDVRIHCAAIGNSVVAADEIGAAASDVLRVGSSLGVGLNSLDCGSAATMFSLELQCKVADLRRSNNPILIEQGRANAYLLFRAIGLCCAAKSKSGACIEQAESVSWAALGAMRHLCVAYHGHGNRVNELQPMLDSMARASACTALAKEKSKSQMYQLEAEAMACMDAAEQAFDAMWPAPAQAHEESPEEMERDARDNGKTKHPDPSRRPPVNGDKYRDAGASGKFTLHRRDETKTQRGVQVVATGRRKKTGASGMKISARKLVGFYLGCEERPFVASKPAPGGIIMIDCSGSMRVSDDQISSILNTAPCAEIYGYRGDGLTGEIITLARDGRMASLSAYEPRIFGANAADYPALLQLISSPQRPKIFVSDCEFNGGEPGWPMLASQLVSEASEKGIIEVLPTMAEAVSSIVSTVKRLTIN